MYQSNFTHIELPFPDLHVGSNIKIFPIEWHGKCVFHFQSVLSHVVVKLLLEPRLEIFIYPLKAYWLFIGTYSTKDGHSL